MEEYRISQEYLDKVIDSCSRKLVGKTMKRFEIFDKKEDIKKAIKELIYESCREIKTLIESFSSGIRFISRPKK